MVLVVQYVASMTSMRQCNYWKINSKYGNSTESGKNNFNEVKTYLIEILFFVFFLYFVVVFLFVCIDPRVGKSEFYSDTM